MGYTLLLSPLQIGQLTLPNRIVMPPMCTFLSEDNGMANQAHFKHYQSSLGPGLVIVEGTAVLPDGRISRRQLGIYSDSHIEGVARIAHIIHSSGAVAGIQLHHAGALAFQGTSEPKTRDALKKIYRLWKLQHMGSGLHRIFEAFQNAARRAVEAGFDIVEIHGAHGYLFSQLLSPLKNRRKDRYGGSLENRRRFLLEVYRGVWEEVGKKALVTCRLGVADRRSGGLTLSEGLSTASLLESDGAQLLDVSCGSGIPTDIRPERSRYSGLLHLARAAKSVVKIPIIGGGGILHPELAELALKDGMTDLIAVGRGILADPAWAQKTIQGKPESIAVCRQCKTCFHYTDSSRCPAHKPTAAISKRLENHD